MQRPNNDNRQRKLRAKQKPNNYLISTDGTTSGDDGSETKNKQEQETAVKLDQMLKPSNQMVSDLEAGKHSLFFLSNFFYLKIARTTTTLMLIQFLCQEHR